MLQGQILHHIKLVSVLADYKLRIILAVIPALKQGFFVVQSATFAPS